ncbi:MAG: hypothetical protein N2504_07680, partial [candidate division WOR-3 bacterium]|nr:hypothetical protein [candidate division WOR-3 bacterium]
MKRKAENFYLAVNHVPEILGLTYTERPEEYNMTFISYFYEKEKVAYIFDGALHIKEIPKGGNITILSQPGIPSEIDMVLLNFEHFYITHIPQSIHANVLVLPE